MSLGDEDGYGSDAGRTSDAYSTIGGTRQTRTRLPDGPAGDAYGPRRPVRNSRSLITFVGVVVLLLGAIAFANMGGDDGSGGKSGSGTNDKTGAAPTAATGTKPVTGKTGTIPSGFAHDQQGAESAAANYSVALGSACDVRQRPTSRHRRCGVRASCRRCTPGCPGQGLLRCRIPREHRPHP